MDGGTPLLNGVETNSLGYHVLAAVAAYMEGCFIPDLLTIDVLTLNSGEWFAFLQIAFAWLNLLWVIGLREVEIVCAGSSERTHPSKLL